MSTHYAQYKLTTSKDRHLPELLKIARANCFIQLTVLRSLLLICINIMKRIVKACALKSNREEPFSLRHFMLALLYELTRTPLNVYVYATLDQVSADSLWG